MKKVLVSFLGKARRDQENGQYREANYRFEDGQEIRTRYFGQALTKRERPDRLVLLGTAGSMWDVLFSDMGHGDDREEDCLALMDEVEENRVDAQRLERLTPLLEARIGVAASLRLIPFGRDEAEQMEILEILAREVDQGDHVILDLTHGFRHLPMLGLLSALYLRAVKKAEIKGLYYGALDMSVEGITPVLRLDGMMTLANWIGALEKHDQSGDLSVFAPLLPSEADAWQRKVLEKGAYCERVAHASLARQSFQTFAKWFESLPWEGLSPVLRLFREPLLQRIGWIRKRNPHQREAELARRYFERKDYLRAALFLYESMVSKRAMEMKLDPENFGNREECTRALRSESKDFKTLSHLRNAMAHGLRPENRDVGNLLGDEERLRSKLKTLFKLLKP